MWAERTECEKRVFWFLLTDQICVLLDKKCCPVDFISQFCSMKAVE